ncbi:MAG TPA: transcriptional repressor LexA [Verrucomicrobiae bacterium]|nr:transcriptional repressor LexA [Verrucomicrobiae bacterium]
MLPLTEKQEKILAFVREQVRGTGMPPTREEIAREFGFAVRASAEEHLRAIARKGYIELIPGASRGIRLKNGDAHPFRATFAGREEMSEKGVRPYFSLPVVGRVAAGEPILSAEHVESTLAVDPALFHPRADFLFRVQGRSMQDAGILDGDLVGVRQQDVAENGQIVVARLAGRKTGEDEITLKRYFRRGHRVELRAENRDYAPIEIDLGAQDPETQERAPVAIEGLYVGLIRIGGGKR